MDMVEYQHSNRLGKKGMGNPLNLTDGGTYGPTRVKLGLFSFCVLIVIPFLHSPNFLLLVYLRELWRIFFDKASSLASFCFQIRSGAIAVMVDPSGYIAVLWAVLIYQFCCQRNPRAYGRHSSQKI